jgi:hypothetical protein
VSSMLASPDNIPALGSMLLSGFSSSKLQLAGIIGTCSVRLNTLPPEHTFFVN